MISIPGGFRQISDRIQTGFRQQPWGTKYSDRPDQLVRTHPDSATPEVAVSAAGSVGSVGSTIPGSEQGLKPRSNIPGSEPESEPTLARVRCCG